jgi:hypothetical protein
MRQAFSFRSPFAVLDWIVGQAETLPGFGGNALEPSSETLAGMRHAEL